MTNFPERRLSLSNSRCASPLILGLIVFSSCAAAADSVVDGDTHYVGRLKYKLCGIDAPERGQPGSQAATDHLRI
jgi:endonuclease YncB( thermonuclease family)